MTLPDGITVVTEPAEEYLNQKQLVDYRSEREDCLSWLLTFGKNPKKANSYALGTVEPRAYRIDQFYPVAGTDILEIHSYLCFVS